MEVSMEELALVGLEKDLIIMRLKAQVVQLTQKLTELEAGKELVKE